VPDAASIKHNNVLGYFVEVPQAVGETFLKAPLATRPSSTARPWPDAMRFSTVELGELEAKIAGRPTGR
jgi:DNA mismatch repair protein MutS